MSVDIGFKAYYYTGGNVIVHVCNSAATLASMWKALPQDGCLFVKVFEQEICADGTHYARHYCGRDRTYRNPVTGEFVQTDESRSSLLGGDLKQEDIKEGYLLPDPLWETVYNTAFWSVL